MVGRPPVDPAIRFAAKFERRGDDECWTWNAGRDKDGYGKFRDTPGVDTGRAHRYAYRVEHGEIPAGMVIRHTCDNPPCVNPAHLSLGTYLDNSRDRAERSKNIKLTAVEVHRVVERLDAGLPLKVIAGEFDLSIHMVSQINTGTHWSQITGRSLANSRYAPVARRAI